MNTKVGIIGAGQFGSTLAWLAGNNGCEVVLFSSSQRKVDAINQNRSNPEVFRSLVFPKSVSASENLSDVLESRDVLILAIPMAGVREILGKIGDRLKPGTLILSVTKGIEIDSGLTVSRIIETSILSEYRYAALSGPNFAIEIIKQVPTATVVASDKHANIEQVRDILGSSFFRVYGSADVLGVELAGALKHILAIAVGVHDSLKLGFNSRAALVTRGLSELNRFAVELGAHQETLMGLSGIGDILLSTTSNLSRNYRLGTLIGKNVDLESALAQINSTVEGVGTCRSVVALAAQKSIDMPITEAVAQILFDSKPPMDALVELMNRPWKYES